MSKTNDSAPSPKPSAEGAEPDIIKIFETLTGVPISMAIDAAGDPKKEQRLLRHISEKIKDEVRNGKL